MKTAKAIIGLGFGDEGKGISTDFLCSNSSPNNTIVVRFSGGHQASHTVNVNGLQHVFSNFGSGTLRNIPTYWSKFCTVSPINFMNEYIVLTEKGFKPKIYIDYESPIVTPYDKHFNQTSKQNLSDGTCGVGFGATIQREENNFHLNFYDLHFPKILKIKIDQIQKYYGFDLDLKQFYEACCFIVDKAEGNSSKILNNYSNLIFEGSQGLLLDKDIGFFPHVTRSNTSTKNILSFTKKFESFIITRAYQTRHGNGPMTNLNIPNNIKINPHENNVTNQYQGEFKRSILDLDLLSYALGSDSNIVNPNLIITCLDHVENEYRFTFKNKIVYCEDKNDFVNTISKILNCKKVYISSNPDSKYMEQFK